MKNYKLFRKHFVNQALRLKSAAYASTTINLAPIF